jgi:aldose 1-epimerase
MNHIKTAAFIVLSTAMALSLSCAKDHKPSGQGGQASPEKSDHHPMHAMNIQKSEFGKTKDGQSVDLYTLTNANGVVAKITNFGGIITQILVPDRNGKMGDIVLGFDNFAQYEAGHPFFGAIAGRYANRIAKGKFTLDGKEYTLAINNGPNSLHGGKVGFDKKVWKASTRETADGPSLSLQYTSPDMEEGYPGTLNVTVVYTLTSKNELKIDYAATTDKDTVLNLTNHSYWNLAGAGSGTVDDQIMMINADKYTPVDDTQIPTGELKSVKGTPFDFTSPTAIGARIDQVPPGYDHNYVLNKTNPNDLSFAVRAIDPKSGRELECYTTQPGVQLYTGNYLDGTVKGIGGTYVKHGAFCLETQHFPDSPNHPQFPSTELRPGQTFRSTTVYRFSVAK